MLATLLITLLMACMPASADTAWQKLSWTTSDGVQMAGLYHPASRTGAYTWVLLHGLGSNKEEWKAFSENLAPQGNGIFIYDARGHYESTHLKNGQPITYMDWRTGGVGSQWSVMPADLSFIVGMLHEKFGLPENEIAVGGASLGANVALVYASQHREVPALILLSPGLQYAGIATPAAYRTYQGRPVFMAATPGDAYAYTSMQELASMGSGNQQVVVLGTHGHGVNMFDSDFTRIVLDWMKGLDGNRNRRPS